MLKNQAEKITTTSRVQDTSRISEQLYKQLVDEIVKGRISPNSRLVESHIAKQSGISRTPVREALHLLERDGWLESVPRVGYIVKPITRRELQELREIRLANESLALRWAIDRISPQEVQTISAHLDQGDEYIQAGRWEAFVVNAAEFHGLLAKASGSHRLYELCQNLRRQMLRYRLESLYNSEACRRVNQGHRRILDYVKALDPDGAVRELGVHLKMSEQTVLQYAFKTESD
jgi:DNA-binding GntR family transcriptional regulator